MTPKGILDIFTLTIMEKRIGKTLQMNTKNFRK